VKGNEEADHMAKRASKDLQIDIKVSKSTAEVKRLNKKEMAEGVG